MTEVQKLELRRSKIRERFSVIAGLQGDAYSAEIQTEEAGLQVEYGSIEVRVRTAIITEEEELEAAKHAPGNGVDPEVRARLELRSRASVTNFVIAAMKGRAVTGPEAELHQACELEAGQIPMELWDVPRAETRSEHRDITPAPATTGINLDVLRPAVFAPSIADKLGIEMPAVGSGTYAVGTITTSATADAVGKSAEVPEMAGGFTVQTTMPKRVGASLNLAVEDVAAIGASNFESILRQHISLVLSDELDDQMLNGTGANDDLTGIFQRLTDPSAPAAGVAIFDSFVSSFASGIDGLWASRMADVSILAGPETYRLSAQTYRDATGQDLGETAFSDHAMSMYGGWWTNKRMPDSANDIQQAILYRKGHSTLPSAMRTAVCPHWGFVSVDDIFTGARKGERRFLLSTLVGDVLLIQGDVYAQVSYRTSI